MRVLHQNTTPMCMSGISGSDQMSNNSSGCSGGQEEPASSFGQNIRLNQTVCVAACHFKTWREKSWRVVVYNPAGLYLKREAATQFTCYRASWESEKIKYNLPCTQISNVNPIYSFQISNLRGEIYIFFSSPDHGQVL